MKLRDIRRVLATAVEGAGTVPLHGYAYAPADPVTPAGVVEPESVDYRARDGATFARGSEVWTLSVFVLLGAADADSASEQLDAFFDREAEDLKHRLEHAFDAEDELTASVEVTGADRWGEYPIAGKPPLSGLRLVVEVLA